MEPATSARGHVPTLEGFADADMKKRGSAFEFGCGYVVQCWSGPGARTKEQRVNGRIKGKRQC